MIIYDEYLHMVAKFLKLHRPGIPFGPNNPTVMYELASILCKASYEHGFSQTEVEDFLEAVAHNKINTLITDGQVHEFSELLCADVTNTRLYYAIEYDLMYFKPGKSQTGPGEFATAFYGADVTFTTDPNAGFDLTIVVSTYEYKKLGTNLLSSEKLDSYTASPVLDYVAVVMPVSDATKPQKRTLYAAGADWRTFLALGGSKGKKLMLQNA